MKMSDKPAYIVYNTQIEYRQLKLDTSKYCEIYTFCNKSTIEFGISSLPQTTCFDPAENQHNISSKFLSLYRESKI